MEATTLGDEINRASNTASQSATRLCSWISICTGSSHALPRAKPRRGASEL